MTLDTYGKWLPKGDKAVIDSLDDPKPLVDKVSRAKTPTPLAGTTSTRGLNLGEHYIPSVLPKVVTERIPLVHPVTRVVTKW